MKILAALFLFVLILGASFGINCWVMICGWGVSPASWGVIIGGFAISFFLPIGLELVKRLFKD